MLEQSELPREKLLNSNRVRRSSQGVALNDTAENGYPFKIANEAIQRQAFLSQGDMLILDKSPLSTLLPNGDIFPKYSLKGHDNAPEFESLDSGIAKRWELIPQELGEAA